MLINVSLSQEHLGKGIVGYDSYQGTGYVMYSDLDVRERFDIRSDQASSFVTVTYDADAQTWYYLANNERVPFAPHRYDRLIAEVDFAADTVTLLDQVGAPVGGIGLGYVSGDISIHANRWDNKKNLGEFMVKGTELVFDVPSQTIALDAEDLGKGIVGFDSYQGTGYIMYSSDDVRARFDIRSDQASAFVSVTYDAQAGQWFYLADKSLVPFEPTGTDVLIAEVDFKADTVSLLQIAGDVALPDIHGVQAGVSDTDITIAANRWDGAHNAGEFQVTGTYLTVMEMDVPNETRIQFQEVLHGVAATDNRTGEGFMLYSQENLHDRFDQHIHVGDDHFVAVVHQDDTWYYDTNYGLVAFEPAQTDILVASIDFGSNSVQDLQGYNASYHGIILGYDEGNLTFHPERFEGGCNKGEFDIRGDWFTQHDEAFVFADASTFVSRTTLPNGALGSTADKGWTCTGLFYDDGAFWSGNDGRMNNKDKTHEPSVIKMSLDGTEILEQIDVHALEADAGVSWNIKTIQGVIVDGSGDLWVASSTSNIIFKINVTHHEDGSTSYALDTENKVSLSGANGLAFNPNTQEMIVYSTSTGYLTYYDISSGGAVETYSVSIGGGGDQLFYDAENDHLYMSKGGNGKPGYLTVHDGGTGEKIGQTQSFSEVRAAEGISIVDDKLYFQSDAFYHPEGPVDLNQLIIYDLDPLLNGTEHLETEAVTDWWF